MNKLGSFLVLVIFIVAAGFSIYFAKEKAGGDKPKENNVSTNATQTEVTNTSNSTSGQVSTPKKDLGLIFFYGSTCPHCKKVEQFMDDNKIRDRIIIDMREVYGSKDNQKLMMDRLNTCKDIAEEDKGGVPFLYSPNKCIIGDQPIIDYLTNVVNS